MTVKGLTLTPEFLLQFILAVVLVTVYIVDTRGDSKSAREANEKLITRIDKLQKDMVADAVNRENQIIQWVIDNGKLIEKNGEKIKSIETHIMKTDKSYVQVR